MNRQHRDIVVAFLGLGLSAFTACSGNPSSGGSNTAGGSNDASGGASDPGGTTVTDGGSLGTGGSHSNGGVPSTGGAGNTGTCMVGTLLNSLGKSALIVGASMEDATATAAPFDGRYLYLSGGYFDGSDPCTSCASGCTTNGTSCANSAGGCGWWGCWQWDQDPPGAYVSGLVTKAASATYNGAGHAQVPMFTYYQVLQASGSSEGAAEVKALNNATFLHKYFADFRLMLQKISSSIALVHIEPDFWGYVEQSGSDPHAMAAPVTTANPTDCATAENSVAGFSRCLIAMTRKYSANARVGLHASAWGTNIDVLANTSASFDVAGEGKKLGTYLLALGAADGDFVVADMSDRDAGYYQQQSRNTWWDDTNAKLPNFHQAFTWAKAVSDTVGRPILWWQIPVGNMSQNNTSNHYTDNRVDYLFSHPKEVAAANGAGMFFGAGDGQQTTPESDGGNLIAKVKAYAAAPVSGCP
jgi:hypothetical protein